MSVSVQSYDLPLSASLPLPPAGFLAAKVSAPTDFPPPPPLADSRLAIALGPDLLQVLQGMLNRGQSQDAMIALFDCSCETLNAALIEMDLPMPADRRWNRGPEKSRWTVLDTQTLSVVWTQGYRVSPIAEGLGRKTGAVYAKARLLGLPKRGRTELRDGPLPDLALGLAPLEPLSIKAAAPNVPPPAAPVIPPLLSWSDLIGVPADFEISTNPLATTALVAPAERELPKLRKLRVGIPDSCRGYTAPATREQFQRFFNRLSANVLFWVRHGLRGLPPETREDEVQSVCVAALEWFVNESPNNPGQPRFLNYDPSRNIEYWQYLHLNVAFKIRSHWKALTQQRGKDFQLREWDSSDDLDDLLANDTTAAVNLRVIPVSPDRALDYDAFIRAATKISDHHAGTTNPNFRAAASFLTLLHGVQQGRDPEAVRHTLETEIIRDKVSPDQVKSWRNRLIGAAELFRSMGETGLMAHYGVPA